MKKIIKTSLLLFFGALMIFVNSCSENPQSALYHEIKSTNKLCFAKMSITKTALVEDKEWKKIGGKRIGVYSYDTYMRAYIDLSSLQMEDLMFDEDKKTVKVMLPPIKTEFDGRDMGGMKKVYENITGIRHNISADERAKAKEQANTDLKKEVKSNPMFDEHLTQAAESKARKYFETIFENSGYIATIDFKPSK